MSLPEKKAATVCAGGIRWWLSTFLLSVVALVLTLVVISLSVGSARPGASLDEYLFVKANDLRNLSSELTDGNDTAIGVPLPEEVLQGGQEVLVDHNAQSDTFNSSKTSLRSSEIDTKVPDPVSTDDIASAPDEGNLPVSSDSSDDLRKTNQGSCDLYHGQWVFDFSGPLYTNNSCPVITQMQNCQGNGRPDKDYENYRWKPKECILPRFDGRKFLELMRGKTLAFVGDSVARNQMESLLCILWQAEAPVNRGSRRMIKWIFRSTSTIIIRIWSSWLVHRSTEAVGFAPKGIDKVFLDIPDETFMEFVPKFDVLVLSSGHWFAKRSAYILNGNVVGGQLWWPRQAEKMQINSIDAFGISVETCLTAVATNPNFTGIAIVRTYSPDHYEGGAWNTGGSCTGKVKPLDEVVRNGFTDAMYGKQVAGFTKAVKNSGKHGSRLKLMDITEPFALRPDGHPGPYRSTDPNKKTQRGLDGRPPPQDCLHWCMPGPVDTWNEMLLETIRRQFEGAKS
ncbi:hypothetical protein GUJ93_ZPchr0007g5245 [Zizania palustris]|uniref:Trichome birefringence-like N-terminal domain-containing protein n=1 Tax=Zizania palustris TaxID=103762 RepID=A0A8J5VYH2_ZIZPA|nr:hypothetical protein GUJ93_ZPchr0007g5245 [Zizania palustris]KAG8078857.1 hypothetical protein GUJ93_ZPchr0007g5245 [Zizania palustris]